jgi:hypothetical protein
MGKHNGHRSQEQSGQEHPQTHFASQGSQGSTQGSTPGATQIAEAGGAALQGVRDLATGAADTAREQAKAGATALGSGMRNLATTLRDKVPHEGMVGNAASTLADTLERSGRHLEEDGFNGLADDVSRLVRNNPIPALCVGIGLGFLAAQVFRSER